MSMDGQAVTRACMVRDNVSEATLLDVYRDSSAGLGGFGLRRQPFSSAVVRS